MSKSVDLAGWQFGRLTALKPVGSRSGHTHWLCKCQCGNNHEVSSNNLRRGKVRSCGCFSHDLKYKHGKPPEYGVWCKMRYRCENPKGRQWINYGGRGIRVCDRWQDFGNFLSDMGSRPSAQYSIERLDVNGNYEPNNCVWAKAKQQANNRRTNHYISVFGESKTLAQWSEDSRCVVKLRCLSERIRKGWDAEEAITTPVLRVRKQIGSTNQR